MQITEFETRHSDPTVREGLGNQFSVLIGLFLLALVGFAFASLSSWSVLDPSFSNANGREVTNMVGFPGAVFADLSMQFLGLGSALALVPPAIWGWSKLLQRPINGLRVRLLMWPLGVLLACGFFSCFAIPQSWPLPLGLGGVIGDMVLRLPAFLLGEVSGFIAVILGLVLGAA